MKSALTMMPNADMELPYDGAKEMMLVDDVYNKDFLRKLPDKRVGSFRLRRKRSDKYV